MRGVCGTRASWGRAGACGVCMMHIDAELEGRLEGRRFAQVFPYLWCCSARMLCTTTVSSTSFATLFAAWMGG